MFDTIGGMIIPVTSVEEACRFYGGRLELPFIGMIEKKWAGFRVGEKEVWLIQTTPEFPVKPGGDVALFFPVLDIDAAIEHLEAVGVSPAGPGVELPTGARKVPYRDPDGNLFVVYESPARAVDSRKAS